VLEDLLAEQARLRADAERVEPLRLTDLQLARASIRLYETSGELSGASRGNVLAVAAGLESEAQALEDRRGALVWELKSAWADTTGGVIAGQSLDEYVVEGWAPDVTSALIERYDAELGAAVPGHMRLAGTKSVPRDPQRIAELEAEGATRTSALKDAQAEARRIGEQQARMRAEAALLAAAVAPDRDLVPA
jgi:hypothetical protein